MNSERATRWKDNPSSEPNLEEWHHNYYLGAVYRMGDVHDRYYDGWIDMGFKLLDHLADCEKVWHQIPDYRKDGKLLYFRQLRYYLSVLRSGRERGRLTKAQERRLRNLERLAEKALPLIDFLTAQYQASMKSMGDQ